jgi:FAD/FMN-containing dehydrogenase
MSKIAEYLRQHMSGEVVSAPRTRQFFATDASIFTIRPQVVVYPRTTNDVRRTARFCWRLAEKGFVLPITPRGSGTDQTGAAIGSGVVMSFPAHMSKILELDTKSRAVRVQPGMNFKALTEAMATHGLFLPPFPTSYKYSTIGGAIASNSSGEKSIKYGSMRSWIDRLEVVLANGEVIQTGRLSRHELNAKKGSETLEGEIYRAVDGLISDNATAIAEFGARDIPNTTGYAIDQVKNRDGSFDLTPLFVGSQGTLGIITQAIVRLAPRPDETELIAAAIDDGDLAEIVTAIHAFEPSVLDFIDGKTLALIAKQNNLKPYHVLTDKQPAFVLFVEFDDMSESKRARKARKVEALLANHGVVKRAKSWEEQEDIWDIRHSVSAIVNFDDPRRAALPVTTDAVVAPEQIGELIENTRTLLKKQHITAAIWGHVGNGGLNVVPLLDLAQIGDRQRVFKFMKAYFEIVLALGGSIGGGQSDGRLRAPFGKMQYGDEMATIFAQLKQIFDPKATLNSGVIVGTDVRDLVQILRPSYDLTYLSDHQPRM